MQCILGTKSGSDNLDDDNNRASSHRDCRVSADQVAAFIASVMFVRMQRGSTGALMTIRRLSAAESGVEAHALQFTSRQMTSVSRLHASDGSCHLSPVMRRSSGIRAGLDTRILMKRNYSFAGRRVDASPMMRASVRVDTRGAGGGTHSTITSTLMSLAAGSRRALSQAANTMPPNDAAKSSAGAGGGKANSPTAGGGLGSGSDPVMMARNRARVSRLRVLQLCMRVCARVALRCVASHSLIH